jgi:hypothetical protein
VVWFLYRSDIKPDRRSECCDNLFSLVRGRAHGLMFAHDTSRVFQTLMKYGTNDHKAALFEELKGLFSNYCYVSVVSQLLSSLAILKMLRVVILATPSCGAKTFASFVVIFTSLTGI